MSSYLNFYEMSAIPCSGEEQHEYVTTGLKAVNVDGRAIGAGLMFNGKCHIGGISLPNVGYVSSTGNWPGNASMWYANNQKYSIGGVAVASSNNAVKLSRLSFGL